VTLVLGNPSPSVLSDRDGNVKDDDAVEQRIKEAEHGALGDEEKAQVIGTIHVEYELQDE